jgi:hypothetical protein
MDESRFSGTAESELGACATGVKFDMARPQPLGDSEAVRSGRVLKADWIDHRWPRRADCCPSVVRFHYYKHLRFIPFDLILASHPDAEVTCSDLTKKQEVAAGRR